VPTVNITRDDFLRDRQGGTFADVVNDPEQPFDLVLDFLNDEEQQRHMEGTEAHHARARLVEVVWDLETQPLIETFLSSRETLRTRRFREAVGVVVRMVVESLARKRTVKENPLGVPATTVLRSEAYLPGKPLA
jgi:hypothetical protein